QHPAFVAETVAEELTVVAQATAQEVGIGEHSLNLQHIVATALHTAGLEDYEQRHIDELSPGERRRLGFTRVLTRLLVGRSTDSLEHAWLVVLDEPTAHLDRRSASRIRRVLRDLAHGMLPDGSPTSAIV